jgi:hypothetical protein
MGYLDSSTIVVDAILTKHGRKLLSDSIRTGNSSTFNITHFALSDDGIDHGLWNVDHPSGSAFYGEAITNLPQLEVAPDNSVSMKYLLTTLPDRNVTHMPYIASPSADSYTLSDVTSIEQITPNTVNGTDSSYFFYVLDDTILTVSGFTDRTDVGATTEDISYYQNVPNNVRYSGTSIGIQGVSVSSDVTTTIIIVGRDTGAIKQVSVTVNSNQRKIV